MKKFVISVILLVCLFILSVNVALAVDKSISVNPIGIAFDIPNAQYEVTSNEISSTIYKATVISMGNISGWEIDYGMRRYAKEVQNSGYFGFELGYADLKISGVHYNGSGVIASLGYKKTFDSGITFDAGANGGLIFAFEYKTTRIETSAGLYLNVGYGW